MKVSDKTSVSMPIKNMIGIVVAVAMGVFAYTEVTARLTSLETSRELFQADLLKKSNEIYNLTRRINTRLGMSRKDDTMPYKVYACPIQTGSSAGRVIDPEEFERLLNLYYKKREWSSEGIPSDI